MTTYLCDIPNSLAAEIQDETYRVPGTWRLLEKVGTVPPAFAVLDGDPDFDYSISRWKVEDEDAPAELEGKLVEPVFNYHWDADYASRTVTIKERRVWD